MDNSCDRFCSFNDCIFLLTYCLEVQGLDYILIPNSVLYLGVLFGINILFFGYLEPILE
jgi:hypothetical protein